MRDLKYVQVIIKSDSNQNRQDICWERARAPHLNTVQDQGGEQRDRRSGQDPAGVASWNVRGNGTGGEDGVHTGADEVVFAEQGLHQGADHQQEDQRQVLRFPGGRC